MAKKKKRPTKIPREVKKLLTRFRPEDFVHIERMLRLPFGTLEDPPEDASLLALMKVIVAMPWMLQVADQNYDPTFARGCLIEQFGIVVKQNAVDALRKKSENPK